MTDQITQSPVVVFEVSMTTDQTRVGYYVRNGSQLKMIFGDDVACTPTAIEKLLATGHAAVQGRYGTFPYSARIISDQNEEMAQFIMQHHELKWEELPTALLLQSRLVQQSTLIENTPSSEAEFDLMPIPATLKWLNRIIEDELATGTCVFFGFSNRTTSVKISFINQAPTVENTEDMLMCIQRVAASANAKVMLYNDEFVITIELPKT
jgi:hypothetical protein